GDKKGGLAEIKRGTEVGEGHLRARLEYGIQLNTVGNYPEAAIELRKVLDLDPSHPTALHNLGEVYRETGQEADALPLLLEAWEVSGDPRTANSLGNLYLKMGRESDAVEYFTKAYNLTPYPTVARNLAEAYEKLGQANKAHDWYETALARFNEQLTQGASRADILKGRSFCLAKLDRFDEALADVDEALNLKQNEKLFLFRAAQVYFLAGHREEAFSYLRLAVQAGLSRDEIRNDFVFQPHLDDPKLREILEGN
ncbi:MAG TPA: tetratricopeptide repeat protein, partial [Thermoanaerobaculia bacterium]|nr:tetratricopeptide repeat protein [Thermoanaerobaculia bacterium]